MNRTRTIPARTSHSPRWWVTTTSPERAGWLGSGVLARPQSARQPSRGLLGAAKTRTPATPPLRPRGVASRLVETPSRLREEPVRLRGVAGRLVGEPCRLREEPCRVREATSRVGEEPCRVRGDACRLGEEPVRVREVAGRVRECLSRLRGCPSRLREAPGRILESTGRPEKPASLRDRSLPQPVNAQKQGLDGLTCSFNRQPQTLRRLSGEAPVSLGGGPVFA